MILDAFLVLIGYLGFGMALFGMVLCDEGAREQFIAERWPGRVVYILAIVLGWLPLLIDGEK